MDTGDARLERVLDHVRGPVRRFLKSILLDPDLVDDAAQETYCVLIEKYRARFRARSWESYALRVAWSKAVRRRPGAADLPGALIDPAMPEPGRIEELREVLDRALARLEPESRAMLHLRYEQGLSLRAIAKVLTLPVGTVKSRLHHARHDLRQDLERQGIERAELLLAALWPLFPSPRETIALERAARPGRRALTPVHSSILLVIAVGTVVAMLLNDDAPIPLSQMQSSTLPRHESARAHDAAPPVGSRSEVGTDRGAHDFASTAPLLIVVVRRLDESPVAGATVRLLGSGAGAPAGKTDANGRFSFVSRRPAERDLTRWWVEVDATGFARQWKACLTAVPRSGTVPELSVFLPRPGRASGRVVDRSSGAPLAGAEITLWSSLAVAMPLVEGARRGADPGAENVLAHVTSDADGTFELPCIPVAVGGVEPVPVLDVVRRVLSKSFHGGLRVRHPDRATAWYGLPVPEQEGAEIELVVALDRRGEIRGRVLGTGGAPVANVTVRALVEGLSDIGLEDLADLGPDGPVWRGATDSEGCYTIGDIPCDGEAARRVRIILDRHGAHSMATVEALVAPDGLTDAPDLIVSEAWRPRSLALRVVDEVGHPIREARVAGVASPPPTAGGDDDVAANVPESVVDADGRIQLEVTPAAMHPVRVRARGHGTVMLTRQEVAEETDGGGVFEVELERGAKIRGVLTDAAGRPLAGFDVLAIDSALASPAEVAPPLVAGIPTIVSGATRSLVDGTFELDDLTAVPHHLLIAQPASRRYGVMSPFAAPDMAWCQPDVLPGGDSIPFVIACNPPGPRTRLEFRVVDRKTGALVLVRLEGRLVNAGGEEVCAGVFDTPGRLIFLDAPPGNWILEVAAAGFESRCVPAEVVDDLPREPTIVRLARGGRLAGRISAPPGTTNARVRVVAPDGSVRDVVAVREDGRFEIVGLSEGPCTLHALGRSADRDELLLATPLVIDADARDAMTAELELELRETSTFRIVLQGLPSPGPERARLLAGVRVLVHDHAGRCWIDRRADAFARADAEEDEARVIRGRLPPGDYACSITGWEAPMPSVSLIVPDTSPPTLTIPAYPTLPR